MQPGLALGHTQEMERVGGVPEKQLAKGFYEQEVGSSNLLLAHCRERLSDVPSLTLKCAGKDGTQGPEDQGTVQKQLES